MGSSGWRFPLKKRSPKPKSSPPPTSPSSSRVKLWVQPGRGRSTPSQDLPPDPPAPPRPRVQVLVSPHNKPPAPDEVEEDLLPELDLPDETSPIRVLITPRDHSARNALLSNLVVSLIWMGVAIAVFGGSWVALRLVVNPGSVGWLSWIFPEWSREAERYQRDAPKTLAELEELAEADGLTLGQPLSLAADGTLSGDLLIPVFAQKGCESSACHRLQELRIYHREPGGRDNRYRLGDRLSIKGPDEFFVTAPLVQITAMGPGSSRPLPLDTVERFEGAPANQGLWFVISGVHQPGSDRIRFGYIGWYNPRWQQLRLIMPWTSPAGQLPRWQNLTGQATPELVIDQSIGLEPNFRVYQLAAATSERPIQLNEISLQQTPIKSNAYESALLLARHGLWSPALEVLNGVKAGRGRRWPAYAQAQLDVIKLHASITRQNADRDWANPSQKLMAQIIDGRWENAWDFLMRGLQEDDLLPLLRSETNPLWRRVGAAARISPRREALRRWGALMQYIRQGRGGAIAWLQPQNGTVQANQPLDAQSRRILQQIDEALLNESESAVAAHRFYGTASPVATPDPRNWQQPNGAPLAPQENVQWYRIPVTGIHQAQGWMRSPFPNLFGPAPTPRYLWNLLGLRQDSTLQLVAWNPAGEPNTRQVVVQALRWNNGTLELLASGEMSPEAPSGPLLAYTSAAFTWQNTEGNLRLQDLAFQAPETAETLAQQLRNELQGQPAIAVSAESETENAPFFQHGSWQVDRIDLTGDGQLETLLNLQQSQPSGSSLPPRTLIFANDGTLLYSELSRNAGQQMLAIARTSDAPYPLLIIRQEGRYQLRQWSPTNQRFE